MPARAHTHTHTYTIYSCTLEEKNRISITINLGKTGFKVLNREKVYFFRYKIKVVI